MKLIYLGIIFTTSFILVSPRRVKRFSGNEQRGNDWNWGRNEQLMDGQTKVTSQANWSTKGNGGPAKGRGDTTPSRDTSWGSDGWSSVEQKKEGFDMSWNAEPQGNNKGSAYPDGSPEEGGNLETLLRGVPGMDFPNFVTVPETEFDCSSMPAQGYYGDVEAGCQVFHICQPGNRKDSFLCPVGTIFNQKYFVCDWWFNVNCSDTPSYYNLNNDIYKDPAPVVVTEEIPVTTEKMLPWNAQDLDKKRPTKSWGNQPSMGKQNTRWKDTTNVRGSKPGVAPSSREVSNTWSRSDVQQKEVTVSWGSSSGTAAGAYGSSSTSSNAIIPTTKPIWYGIDGQPAKDQSNGMSKRNGLAQTPAPAPFGTRMRSSTRMGRANVWPSTEAYQPTTPTISLSSHSTSRGWTKGDNIPEISTGTSKDPGFGTSFATGGWIKNEVTAGDFYNDDNNGHSTRGWLKNDVTSDKSKNDANYGHTTTRSWMKNDVSADITGNEGNYVYPTTRGWLKDIPETSINPTGIDGVWEQETSRRSDQVNKAEANTLIHKGLVTKSDNPVTNTNQKYLATSNQNKEWGNRQTSTASNRGWFKQNFEKPRLHDNANGNSIPRRKTWK